MDEIERAAEEIGLPRTRTAGEGFQPEIDDQHRPDQQCAERDLEIACPEPVEGSAMMLPASEQHPAEEGGGHVGKLEEHFPQETHMGIVIIGKNTADLIGPDARKTSLRQKKHVCDGKVDLGEERKQAEQAPPRAEEADEGIAGRARPEDFRKAVFAIEAGKVDSQGSIPQKDRTAQGGKSSWDGA